MHKVTSSKGSKIKDFFFEFIYFSSSRSRVINLSSILILLAVIPRKLLGYSPIKCVFKYLFFPLIFQGECPTEGIFAFCNCPACGMTRGMSRLLHGDISGALAYNKLVILVLLVIVAIIIKEGFVWHKEMQNRKSALEKPDLSV